MTDVIGEERAATVAPSRRVRGPAVIGAAVLGAVDGLLGVALPAAVLAVIALLAWAGLGAAGGWLPFVRGAADVWLLGHGVDVRFDASGTTFTVTAAALGPAVVTALAAVRAGRRAARTSAPTAAWASGAVATAAASSGLGLVGTAPDAAPALWQAALLPTALVAAVSLLGVRSMRVGRPLPDGLRAGVAATALLLAASALLLALLLGARFADVVGLYESLAAGGPGALVLTLLQVLALPTLVVWSGAWLSGAGVALGAGSATGPFGAQVGPLPALPILGVVPADPGAFAAVVLLVPVLTGFAAAALARRAGAVGGALPLGATTGVVAGALLGLLTAATAGSAGPDRFGTVGPDALLVAVLVAALTGLPAMLGFAVLRPRRSAEGPEESGH